MYSLEQRTDAIQLFIESGFNENAVIRSLGYPSPTMTIDCLDRDTIRRYRQRMDNLRPGHVWSELAVEDFLHRIGAMARDTDGKLRPTAAGSSKVQTQLSSRKCSVLSSISRPVSRMSAVWLMRFLCMTQLVSATPIRPVEPEI